MQYFLNLPVWKKLVFVFLLVGLMPMSIIGLESVYTANKIITQQVSNQLSSVRQLKTNAVESYFQRVRKQLETLATNSVVVNAATRMPSAYSTFRQEANIDADTLAKQKEHVKRYYREQFGQHYEKTNGSAPDLESMYRNMDDDSWALQYAYISNNPHALGEKHLLRDAQDNTSYSLIHQAIHPTLRSFLEKFGYYDIFIADIETGDIVYSVFKELDFTTSLSEGPYAPTSIGEAFSNASALNNSDKTVLTDFKIYPPSYDAPASFISTPIFNDGEAVGILIFQIPLEEINMAMSERAGMGETGESYLVGPDHLMRSNSFYDHGFHDVLTSFKNPDKGKAATEAVTSAFAGQTGVKQANNYKGDPVLSSFGTVDLGDFQWAIVAEQNIAEAFAPVEKIKTTILWVAIACAVSVALIALWFSKLISGPIQRVADAIENAVQTGSFRQRVNHQSNDEVGKMAASFNGLLDALSSMFTETNSVLKEVNDANYDAAITNHFNGDMAKLCHGVNTTISEIRAAHVEQQKMQALAEQKAQEAEQTAYQAEEAANAANKIKQALDVAKTSVMMADESNTIVYTNIALDKMMSNVENDIRKDLPQFSAKTLNGSNMDIFHKNPQHQKGIISKLTSTFDTQIQVGGRVFRLVANPITQEGERVGTVVEWEDRTNEVSIEKEIDAAVDAAAKGDFSRSLSLEGKEGFFHSLSTGLNRLLSTTEMALGDVNQVVRGMSTGDLTTKVDKDYEGLFGELKDNLNNTMDKLTNVVSHISQSSQTVLSGANEIEIGMRDLSRRTEEQAASLEESASSMNEMTDSVQNNSDTAESADSLAKDAEQKALQGGEIVKETVEAMQSIDKASSSIANIIGVVEEIAFQTNLLALNAAVEAARAGEQGRGFAVVAAEVRQLAQRSSASAKEIKELIKDSGNKVAIGSDLVMRSGETLNEIVRAVEKVGETISNIADASKEQSSGISQVNIAIGQMDTMTQQNSALVEEATAASGNMAAQSGSMVKAVEFFKTQ